MITSQIFAGTIYYVDATNGNDFNYGLSEATSWQSISKVNRSLFFPGDKVLFKRGEVWREQLNVPSSGSDGHPITFGAYGSGDNPIINGSDIITNWAKDSGNIWVVSCTTEPNQVLFDGMRGTKESSISHLDLTNEWYWTSDVLYIYSTSEPDTAYTSPGIEASVRNYGVKIQTNYDYITVDGLQIEKTKNSSIRLNSADHCTVRNSTFLQWVVASGSDKAAINISANHSLISGNTFGKDTGADADGPNWAGYKGIYIGSGSSNTTISNNYFYHSGNESTADSFYGYGVHLAIASGTDTISGNTFYHNGSHSIYVDADTNAGDVININGNTSSYAGQAGISIYMVRGTDGTGGTINIFSNIISYADRVAGTTPGSGNAANGIHLNDSATPDQAQPFVTCNVYLNTIFNCEALSSPANEDSGGIALDYNADGASVYRNLIYDNYGKGIYIYGGNNNEVYYNIIYGNDAGIVVSAPDGETADGNTVYNNVLYKNYNGALGPGYDTEIWFGLRGDNNLFKDNILYADNSGYAYYYNTTDTSGCITDYNSVYQDSGTSCYDTTNGAQTFAQWKANHPTWDANFLNSDPLMTDPDNGDFRLKMASPCIDAGTDVGLTQDYDGNNVPYGWAVDIGAYEYQGSANPLLAEINASPTSGYVPLAVSFTASASGGTSPYSYSWNFGDGSSSSSQNPSHTYSAAGNYTATLTVTDSASSQDIESVTINAVNTLPLVASIVASPASGQTPLTVNFTGSATGGSPPYTYSWNFGDGASSSTQNPSHTYSDAGNYTATLTITDSTSNQDSESVTISASVPLPHTVTTPNTPSGPTNGFPSVSYAFTTGGSSCSQGHSIEYRFDWGEGAYSAWSSSTIASHSWPAAGSYAVKAQARCSINHSIVSGWSSEKTVTITTSSYFNLALSSATGSPTPGQGGTTNPSPGNHSYPSGNSVLVSAITNTDYRFSKWTGDISGSDTYDEEITVSMNQNKSISAYFCTKCGDVNGDLNITPADAQEVFEIFLGIISDPTDCQKENADVNCDGTKTDPKITPGDAQAIFEKFLGINALPGDCSCKSRAESAGTLAIQERAFVQLERSANINLIINDIELKPGKIIAVPVIIDNPSNIKAFGFDILFESEILEFVGVVRTELLKDFNEVDGNEIAQGVLRVGGYSSEPIRSYSPGALIRLIFKVTGETEEPCPFLITNTVDDLENASFQNRTYMRKKIRRKDIVF